MRPFHFPVIGGLSRALEPAAPPTRRPPLNYLHTTQQHRAETPAAPRLAGSVAAMRAARAALARARHELGSLRSNSCWPPIVVDAKWLLTQAEISPAGVRASDLGTNTPSLGDAGTK